MERVQNKFIRHLYAKIYGVNPFYPPMYLSLFVLGLVGYNRREVRRDIAFAQIIVKILDILNNITYAALIPK